MPKASKSQGQSSATTSHFLLKYGSKRVVATRQTSYSLAVESCRKLFSDIAVDSIVTFHTKDLDFCEGEMAEISEESWSDIVGLLKSVTVMVEKSEPAVLPVQQPLHSESLPGSHKIHKNSKVIPLKIRIMGERREISLKVSATDTRTQIEALLAAQLGKNPLKHDLVNNGNHFFGIDQSLRGVLLEYRKKPVNTAPTIYLLTPKSVQASMTLSLSSHWTLSGTCPMLPIKPRSAKSPESITWKVVAHPGGVLTDPSNGSGFYRVAWEAQKYPGTLDLLPETNPSPDLETVRHETSEFNPNIVVLNDENAAILMPDKYYEYSFYRFFDNVLAAMGIAALARICFESSLKESLSKHEYVAVRFLAQDFYSKAAPLSVSPSPDVIIRIFVVFQGIKETDLKNWPTALERGRSEDVSWYRDMIGGDFDRAMDVKLFRVLELGGMEITPQF